MKKILATILALVMAIGVTTMAWATETNVAKVGEAQYATLQEAVNAAAEGQTVQLIADTKENVTINKNLTLDLNGKTLTNNGGDTITVQKGATLIINGSGTVDNVTHAKAAIYNNGTVTLNGGKYTRSAETGDNPPAGTAKNSYYNILNHGIMEINDTVIVEQEGNFSSLVANGYYSYSDSNERSGYVENVGQAEPKMTINGGTFSGGINTIKNDDGATLTINNGNFSNITQAVVQNNNVAFIKGGTFDGTGYHAVENRYFAGGKNEGKITVENGTFKGEVYVTTGATTEISGGSYDVDVSGYANTNVARLDGTYYVGDTAISNAVSSMGVGDTLTVVKGTVTINGSPVTAGSTYTVPPRYYYNSTTTTTDTKKADGTKGSPKTFDAGVGIYAVSAILSVTGMAYVGKKKF